VRKAAIKTAKLFKNGQSQAMRLPREFRFYGDRVYIKRSGNSLVLMPVGGSWDSLRASLDKFTDDFLSNRDQPENQERERLFG